MVLASLCAGFSFAQPLESLAKAHLTKPSAATENALKSFAQANSGNRNGALACLALGRVALEQNRYADAVTYLQASRPALPALSDYTNFYLAEALAAVQSTGEAIPALEIVHRTVPRSPLLPWSVLRAARLLLDAGEPAKAAGDLRPYLASLPEAPARLLLGRILIAQEMWMGAASELQNVYLEYPVSKEASEAEVLLKELQQRMGDSYPPLMPGALIERARRMIRGGAASRAASELRSLAPRLAGADRNAAQVAIGVAQYEARQDSEALTHLRALTVTADEVDAERLYYIFAAARRLGRASERQETLAALEAKHPKSPWRLEALVSEGNRALLVNAPAEYVPAYTACYRDFTDSNRGWFCHWKVAWNAYLRRTPKAEAMMREHLEKFPNSVQAATALYFLGRLAEQQKRPAAARACYETILSRYPGYFYALPARERLTTLKGAGQPETEFLNGFALPLPEAPGDFSIDRPTKHRIDRARLLRSAALYDWAEQELRYGARNGANSLVIAVELGTDAMKRGETARGLRLVKSLAPGYLRWTIDDAPMEFWRLAFPLPYNDTLWKYSQAQNLDPYLIAGLIRQESEFNAQAVSRAGARGLTQIMPSTGRSLSRRLGIQPYGIASLFRPEVNIRMGTFYFRQMLNTLGGDMAAALAAYNAGKSRVDLWQTWGDFREPAEFIETIPFTETRGYVQSVLRNAELYRRIYARPVK